MNNESQIILNLPNLLYNNYKLSGFWSTDVLDLIDYWSKL